MTTEEIELVIDRAKQGDRQALDELLRRNGERIEQAAQRMLGDKLRADVRTSDLVQSTYVDVLTSVESFRGTTEEAFTRWVVRILENNIKDAAKYHGSAKRTRDRESSSKNVDTLPVPDRGPSPSGEAALTEELLLVSRALQGLPKDYRRIILLRLGRGGSHRQAAETMQRSEGATRVLLARARAALLLEVERLRKGGPG